MIVNYNRNIPYFIGPTGPLPQEVGRPGFLTAPLLISISPNVGQSIGGTLVTLTGSQFVGATTITFDGVEATNVTVVSSAVVTCVTPIHNIGSVNVVMTNGNGSSTLYDAFLYRYLADNQDLSQADGISSVTYNSFDLIYEAYMDDIFVGIGREIILHLPPSISEDKSANLKSGPAGYNSFFRGSARPTAGGKNRGVIVETRDIPYTAHIRHGPQPANDHMGVGKLSFEEVQTTTVYESLGDIEDCISVTIDGKRYERDEDARPIGFSNLKYVIIVWHKISEKEK